MATDRLNLYDLDYGELEALFQRWGEPSYRAQQLWEWLYIHLAATPHEMTNLSKDLRARLDRETTIGVLDVVERQVTGDRAAMKDLLRLADGETIEAVLMRYEDRDTACVSSQVGCAVGCPFCATGQMGFRRDLTSGEIVAQVLHFDRLLAEGRAPRFGAPPVFGEPPEEHLNNVVLMGMGEPLLNYDAVLAAIHRLMDDRGYNLGQRHITLSTVGILSGIRRLAQESGVRADSVLQVTLAISLHAATDALRDRLVPINRRYGLDALFAACHAYGEATGRRISFEWALIEGLNDTPEQAQALAARLVGLSAHVNLIPLNPTAEYGGVPSAWERTQLFTTILDRHGVSYSMRVPRGQQIAAGCGQLRQRVEEAR